MGVLLKSFIGVVIIISINGCSVYTSQALNQITGGNVDFKCETKKTFSIVTGPKASTYFNFGSDISKIVADDACIELDVVESSGSISNLKRLAREDGVKFAIAPIDVIQAFRDLAKRGDRKSANIAKNIRIVRPLYLEEAHFVVRKKSKMKNIQDIRGSKINIGPKGSGTSMVTTNIYKELFRQNILKKNIFTYSYVEALERLLNNEIDVIVYLGGQPDSRVKFQNDAQNKFKLLSYSHTHNKQLKSYSAGTIKKDSYEWLNEDIDTISVKSYLVTWNYIKEFKNTLARFSASLNQNLYLLKHSGHAKWNTVKQELDIMPIGWIYHDAVKVGYKYSNDHICSEEAMSLKLCSNKKKNEEPTPSKNIKKNI